MVSVIIPTYNRAHVLPRAIESVLKQTYTELELIVVDDASTDDTAAVMTAITDPRVRYVRKEHGGAAAARNRGIAEAKGEFIAFQDSDDVWHSDKLEKQLAYLRAERADAVFCAFHRCEEGGDVWQTFPHEEIHGGVIRYEELLFENLVSTQTLLARREVLQQERFNERYPALEDWELALRIAKAFKLAYLKEPLVDVFVQRDSLSNHMDRIYAAHRLLFRQHRRAIIRDDRVSQQWMHSFRWCGHACGKRVVGACLRLMSLRRPLRQNYFYLREAHAEWKGIETY